ncbi:MAG: sulfurtransferase [Bacteroidetes bacterium]|nr:sulfurtransferase [Bacteroidota bacterium]
MNATHSPLIETSELLSILDSPNLILVDASGGPKAKSAFEKQHILGTQFIDLETDLSSKKGNPANGGRHPLPTIEQFAKTLTKFGISPDSHVVIYDSNFGANSATRLWWMLKAVGHEKVQVLNGGFQAAISAGLPLSSQIQHKQKVPLYPVNEWKLPTVALRDVSEASTSLEHVIIDVRAAERFDGIFEPIDLIAGHIPGAINIPLNQNLDTDGFFLSKDKLNSLYKEHFKTIPEKNVIVHCGSGVTACHTIFALTYAGFEIPCLYVGSWSEWSRNEKPIAKNV